MYILSKLASSNFLTKSIKTLAEFLSKKDVTCMVYLKAQC